MFDENAPTELDDYVHMLRSQTLSPDKLCKFEKKRSGGGGDGIDDDGASAGELNALGADLGGEGA